MVQDQRLVEAVHTGNVREVQHLLQGGVNPNLVTDYPCHTVLHRAVRGDNIDMVKALVGQGKANVEAPDALGLTPLHHACDVGRLPLVQYLVEEGGANVERRGSWDSDDSFTALFLACANRKIDVVWYLLLEQKASLRVLHDNCHEVLHFAARERHLQLFRYLVEERRLNPEKTDVTEMQTPLHVASINGDINLMKYLVEKAGVNVEMVDSWGLTALHLACRHGHFHCVQYLVCEGRANIQAKDYEWRTPLHHSCVKGGYLRIVRYLAEHETSPDLEALERNGRSPLHIACHGGAYLDVVKFLVDDKHVETSQRDTLELTPLHLSIHALRNHHRVGRDHIDAQGLKSVVEYLLEKQDLNGADDAGKPTPLHTACSRFTSDRPPSPELLDILLQHDPASATAVCEELKRQTPLHALCLHRPPPTMKCFELLLDVAPCTTVVCDSSGSTPLHDALRSSYGSDIIELLVPSSPIDREVMELAWDDEERTLPWKTKELILRRYSTNTLNHPKRYFTLHPLHVIAQCPLATKDDFVECVSMFSKPSIKATMDTKGQLPLHVALSKANTGKYLSRMLKLFELEPRAVLVKESTTGFFPFEAAAAVDDWIIELPMSHRESTNRANWTSNGSTETDASATGQGREEGYAISDSMTKDEDAGGHNTLHVDLVYRMLRYCPQLLRSAE